MKAWRAIAAFTAMTILCVYLGLTCLCNITNPPPKPWILVNNTNISNPDIASFKNCEWSEADKSMVPKNESQPFSFGYLFSGEYRIVEFDTTKDPHFDDSAAFWGGLEDNGHIWSYYPCVIRRPPMPATARFLRAVTAPKSKVPRLNSAPPKKTKSEAITSKDMKRA